jgi:hypothetical protein
MFGMHELGKGDARSADGFRRGRVAHIFMSLPCVWKFIVKRIRHSAVGAASGIQS